MASVDRDDDPSRQPLGSSGRVPALLLTGTSGVGKTTIAAEVWERLVRQGRGSAWIDLDAIAKCDTDDDAGGFFGSLVMAENLAIIWPNYRRHGVDRLVLSRAVPDLGELARLQAAIPDAAITVGLLVASAATIACRLRARDLGQLAGRRVDAAIELQARMEHSGIAHFSVTNDLDDELGDVVATVLARWRERAVANALGT